MSELYQARIPHLEREVSERADAEAQRARATQGTGGG